MSSTQSTPPSAPPGRSARLLKRMALGGGTIVLLCSGAILGPMRCWSAWLAWGIDVQTCPVGTPLARLDASVSSIGRAQEGTVTVRADAIYTIDRADGDWSTSLDVHRAQVKLRRGDGTEVALVPHKDGWEHRNTSQVLRARLPADLPDGDHTLLIEAETRLGTQTLELPLPVFAPATVHLLTDRPLYEPGHTVAFRSVALRARDLVPLGGRPGSFTVTDPTGVTVFEERAPASQWGVASTTFPLATDAPLGTWRACWDSRGTRGCADFEVTEFTLPRFTVAARSRSPWSGRGEAPEVEGTVRLASGAPVANAEISVNWRVDGAWTMPNEWARDGLPKHARTDRAGRFELALPPVPEDLVGTARLVGQIQAVDPAGDVQTTAVSILLSVDDIAVQAVTELADSGVAEGMNNRVWLRATTASGRPLPGAEVSVQRAWDPTAPALTATADADGVAVFQLDPGPPVNVLIEEPPKRTPPPPEPVSIDQMSDPTGQGTVSLADQRALDAARGRLDGCRRYVSTSARSVRITAVVNGGRIAEAHPAPGADSACVARALTGLAMPTGPRRAIELRGRLQPPPYPDVTASFTGWMHHSSPQLGDSLTEALATARRCIPRSSGRARLAPLWSWTTTPGGTRIRFEPVGGTQTEGVDTRCIASALSVVRLSEPATVASVGHLALSTVPPPVEQLGASIPQSRVMLGYELAVAATTPDGEELGTTKLVLSPARIPDIRLRAEPTLPKVGDTVEVTVLRGPDFSGTLPEHLYLRHADGSSTKAKLDEKTRVASFELPADKTGWFTVEWAGQHARLYVAPTGSLSVDLTVLEQQMRPGERAEITVQTTSESGPVPAAVSLFGVDETLGELAALPGPDAMDNLQAQVPTPEPAFGALDGVALVRGAVSGENARAATVLRVGTPPSPAAIDQPVSTSRHTEVSPRTVVVDRFFPILAELAKAERAWEDRAKADDQLTPKQTAELWRVARKAAAAKGNDVTDAYGEPLQLHRLPPDLLDLTAPHAIVTDGARLPDDLENWPQWVAREEPK